MLKIEIIDPQNLSQKELIATAEYLLKIAGHEMQLAKAADLARAPKFPVYEAPPQSQVDNTIVGTENTVMASSPGISLTQPLEIPPPPPVSAAIEEDIPILEYPDPSADEFNSETELDDENIPWDERIHTRSRALDLNGRWKTKHTVKKSDIEKIKNQIRVKVIDVPPPPGPVEITYPALVTRLMKLIGEGRVNHASVQDVIKSVGLGSLADLGKHPELVARVSKGIDLMLQED